MFKLDMTPLVGATWLTIAYRTGKAFSMERAHRPSFRIAKFVLTVLA